MRASSIVTIEHVNGCRGCLGSQLRCGHALYCMRAPHRCANRYDDALFMLFITLAVLVAALAQKGFI